MSAGGAYVYLNVPNDKALIHQDERSHCSIRRGGIAEKSDRKGWWTGLLAAAATMEAAQSGRKRVH